MKRSLKIILCLLMAMFAFTGCDKKEYNNNDELFKYYSYVKSGGNLQTTDPYAWIFVADDGDELLFKEKLSENNKIILAYRQLSSKDFENSKCNLYDSKIFLDTFCGYSDDDVNTKVIKEEKLKEKYEEMFGIGTYKTLNSFNVALDSYYYDSKTNAYVMGRSILGWYPNPIVKSELIGEINTDTIDGIDYLIFNEKVSYIYDNNIRKDVIFMFKHKFKKDKNGKYYYYNTELINQ